VKNLYFLDEKPNYSFVSTGCTKFDCDLGGGFPLGRIVNIVGDASTCKTALACEAINNFIRQYPAGKAAYRDAESAFDIEYAAAMGMQTDVVDFGDPDTPIRTVEDLYRDLEAFVAQQAKADNPGIYVIDSLDALSDEAEMKRDIGDGTYGGSKPKQISTLFRKLNSAIERSKVLFIVVSQERDKIGVMFGEKTMRAGGRALRFYASQEIWLAKIGTIKKTVKGVERPIGINIKARVKKNKIGLAHRTAEFPFIFGYGIEDLKASLEWLKDVKRLDEAGIKLEEVDKLPDDAYHEHNTRVADVVRKVWKEIEKGFLPSRKKYG
jgi:recombination protein RecA